MLAFAKILKKIEDASSSILNLFQNPVLLTDGLNLDGRPLKSNWFLQEVFQQITLAKFWSTSRESHHPAFSDNCSTFNLMFCPYLRSRPVHLCVPCVAKRNKDAWWIQDFVLFFLVIIKRVKSCSELKFSQAGWFNLTCADCLWMIKPVVVGFCLLGVNSTLGNWCRVQKHWHNYLEVFPRLFQNLWMGI